MQTRTQIKSIPPLPPAPQPGAPQDSSQKLTVEAAVLGALPKSPSIFFPDDIRIPGIQQKQIRFTLVKLSHEGVILKLAWGIYLRPTLGEASRKSVLPSPETIAFAVADKRRLNIIPSGEKAAKRVGLINGDVEDSLDWFTNGAPRKIRLLNGKTIRFLMSKEARMFTFKDDRMRDLSNGIRHVGKLNMGVFEMDAVRVWLKGIPEDVYNEDIELCPEWVREVIEQCRQKGGIE